MPIINYGKREQNTIIKYYSTSDADILYHTHANNDGSLNYDIYKDVLFTLQFLDAYNHNKTNVNKTLNGYQFAINFSPYQAISQFNCNSNIVLNNYDLLISKNFTFTALVYFNDLISQQVLFSNNNNFQISLNDIGYNNCIVFKLGNNICYQKNVLKCKRWNKIIFRCDGENLEFFINNKIQKQPIESFNIVNNIFSIGCSVNYNCKSKFFDGYIKQLSLYSSYKNDDFIVHY